MTQTEIKAEILRHLNILQNSVLKIKLLNDMLENNNKSVEFNGLWAWGINEITNEEDTNN